ncbi:MAG: hypothetical protein P9L99_02590 [Candidatus Lernaella stagnicola]|nr:hypothetical protein [Candidatus Lernaella stagnicola]
MKRNLFYIFMLIAVLSLSLTVMTACGDDDDDDDDAAGDDDATGDDDAGGLTSECQDWYESCFGTSLGADTYCSSFGDYALGDGCVEAAANAYLDCLQDLDCSDFGSLLDGALGCVNVLSDALAGC